MGGHTKGAQGVALDRGVASWPRGSVGGGRVERPNAVGRRGCVGEAAREASRPLLIGSSAHASALRTPWRVCVRSSAICGAVYVTSQPMKHRRLAALKRVFLASATRCPAFMKHAPHVDCRVPLCQTPVFFVVLHKDDCFCTVRFACGDIWRCGWDLALAIYS
jgi:hypothetical protein